MGRCSAGRVLGTGSSDRARSWGGITSRFGVTAHETTKRTRVRTEEYEGAAAQADPAVDRRRLTAVALHAVLGLFDALVKALVLLLGGSVKRDLVLHCLANVATRANGMGLVVAVNNTMNVRQGKYS